MNLSDRVITVLNKPLVDLSSEESLSYESLVMPAREQIKHALQWRMDQRDCSRQLWEANIKPDSRAIIDDIAREVLVEPPPQDITNSADSETAGLISTEQVVSSKQNAEGNWSRRALKAFEWVSTILLAIVILLAAFMMLAPRFGLQTHTVKSGSMEPALQVGGMIICRSTPVSLVEVGDIIGFNTQGEEEVTHRVIGISEEGGRIWLQTKGDANEDPDPDLISPTGDTVDKVIVHIPYLGFFSTFMKTKLAFLLFICVPGAILLVLFGRDISKALADIKRNRNDKSPAVMGDGRKERQ